MATHFPAQMPNNCKKGPNLRREAKLATAQTSDDFDGMLAEFRSVEAASISASSITGTAITSIYTSSSASRASTVSPFSSNLQVPKVRVQEAEIVEAIKEADIPKLERWARQGVRVSDAMTLYIACGAGNVAVMRCLVKQLGADVNQMTKVYGRPLMVAADNGRLDIMRCLVNEFGVDVNQTSMNGSTALHCAAQGKHLDAMRVLVKELGADVNKADCEGSTPLQIAAQFGNHDVLQCLLKELGSNVNLVSRRDGGSALHSAAQEGHMNIVRILIENHGADPNIATLVGSTPLMLAIYHPKVAHWLIKNGANPQALHPEYGTVAQISKEFGALAAQTAYLEARVHCANIGCMGVGLKKCAACTEVFYCRRACQLAHWTAHKVECKEAVKLKATQGK